LLNYIRKTYTYFEITTAIAFWYFAKENVEIAMIETGLGGRLDATNVIDPEMSIITSIGLDHTDLLGNTLGSSRLKKEASLKKGFRLCSGDLNRLRLIRLSEHCQKKQSEIISADCQPV
jgi:dihydrofolate synthase / folylpolyglutamate synthase